MCKGDIRACCIPILVANRMPGSVIGFSLRYRMAFVCQVHDGTEELSRWPTEENRSKPSASDLASFCLEVWSIVSVARIQKYRQPVRKQVQFEFPKSCQNRSDPPVHFALRVSP